MYYFVSFMGRILAIFRNHVAIPVGYFQSLSVRPQFLPLGDVRATQVHLLPSNLYIILYNLIITYMHTTQVRLPRVESRLRV